MSNGRGLEEKAHLDMWWLPGALCVEVIGEILIKLVLHIII